MALVRLRHLAAHEGRCQATVLSILPLADCHYFNQEADPQPEDEKISWRDLATTSSPPLYPPPMLTTISPPLAPTGGGATKATTAMHHHHHFHALLLLVFRYHPHPITDA